jgi:hypothetical protein
MALEQLLEEERHAKATAEAQVRARSFLFAWALPCVHSMSARSLCGGKELPKTQFCLRTNNNDPLNILYHFLPAVFKQFGGVRAQP